MLFEENDPESESTKLVKLSESFWKIFGEWFQLWGFTTLGFMCALGFYEIIRDSYFV